MKPQHLREKPQHHTIDPKFEKDILIYDKICRELIGSNSDKELESVRKSLRKLIDGLAYADGDEKMLDELRSKIRKIIMNSNLK